MHRSGNKQRMFLSLKQNKKEERKSQKSVFYLGYFQNILVKMQILIFFLQAVRAFTVKRCI